jgi:hypothetical protein
MTVRIQKTIEGERERIRQNSVRFKQACKATDEICVLVNLAIAELQASSCIVNGYGVLFDTVNSRYSIGNAKANLEKALALIDQAHVGGEYQTR